MSNRRVLNALQMYKVCPCSLFTKFIHYERMRVFLTSIKYLRLNYNFKVLIKANTLKDGRIGIFLITLNLHGKSPILIIAANHFVFQQQKNTKHLPASNMVPKIQVSKMLRSGQGQSQALQKHSSLWWSY